MAARPIKDIWKDTVDTVKNIKNTQYTGAKTSSKSLAKLLLPGVAAEEAGRRGYNAVFGDSEQDKKKKQIDYDAALIAKHTNDIQAAATAKAEAEHKQPPMIGTVKDPDGTNKINLNIPSSLGAAAAGLGVGALGAYMYAKHRKKKLEQQKKQEV